MKHFIAGIALALFYAVPMPAQNTNGSADNIVGNYFVSHEGEDSKVTVTGHGDGTYQARVYWVKDSLDKDGRKRLDEKNPDKALRSTPCDNILLIWDLKYNPEKQRWEKGKIYDPTRGIRANATAFFAPDGKLQIKGSLMGFSETVVWERINE